MNIVESALLNVLVQTISSSFQWLQEPADAQQSFSSSRDPTVWRVIPVLEFLRELWLNMARHLKFDEVEDAIRSGLENLEKWYSKTDDMDVYFVCLGVVFPSPGRTESNVVITALDPNWKLAYAHEKWAKEYFDEGVAQLEKVVRCLLLSHKSLSTLDSSTNTPSRSLHLPERLQHQSPLSLVRLLCVTKTIC